MSWTAEEIERRARWTAGIRRPLYGHLPGGPVLEVGCGPGIICRELAERGLEVVGVDRDPVLLRLAEERGGGPTYRLAEAERLPFADGTFAAVVCHLFLLWSLRPPQALEEMQRVTRPGGVVMALAEPDLGGRVDHPDAGYAAWMRQSLLARGGHPEAGRRLGEWFTAAGLQPRLSAGVVLLTAEEMRPDWEEEWEVARRELGPLVGTARLERWRELDRRALEEGWRVLAQVFFSAWARRG